MKYELTHTEGSRRLLLLFAGWGMDAGVLRHVRRPGYDVMVVWDYTTFHIDWTCVRDYEEICLIAWSMGVYAASQTTQAIDHKLTCRIAVNGTPEPVDDTLGIPEAIFEGTLQALTDASVRKFFRRMCSTAEAFAHFDERRPGRPTDELRAELQAIGDRRLLSAPAQMRWDLAIAGMSDRIFPFHNQRRAWLRAGVPVKAVDEGHYVDFQAIADRYVIDKALVRERFAAGTATYNSHASVQIDVVERLVRLIEKCNLLPALAAARNGIIEIGSGSGMLTRAIARMTADCPLTLYDLSAPMPDDLPPGHDYRYVNCDAELEIARLRTASVDAIFSASTMQWFNSPARFFENCRRVLVPGGYAFLTTFTEGNLHQISDLTGRALPVPTARGWLDMARRHLDCVVYESYERDLDFDSPLEVLRHLKLTGVNALARSDRGAADTRRLLSRYPMMLDGRYHLTYKPLIMILRNSK